jgi:hypothetical protein
MGKENRRRGSRLRENSRGVLQITAGIVVLVVIVALVAAFIGGWFAFNIWPDAPSHGASFAYTGGGNASSGATYYSWAVVGGSTTISGTPVSLQGSSSPFYLGVLHEGSPSCVASYGAGGTPVGVPGNCVASSGDTLIVSVPHGGSGATGISIGGTVLGFGFVGPLEKGGPIGCGYVPPGC